MGKKNPFKVIEESVKDVVKGAGKAVEDTVKTVIDVGEDVGKEVLRAPIKIVKAIPKAGEQIVETVKDVAKGTEDLLVHGGAEDILKDFGKSLEEGVRGTVETGGEVVSDLLEPIEEKILKPIEKGI